mmetsp:Transcript_54100/g.143642  ORF Transcript_54100/g.143642 Transcript_54100/m.143642 type:complete len:175 (+) Transcript_54100:89-613(+)
MRSLSALGTCMLCVLGALEVLQALWNVQTLYEALSKRSLSCPVHSLIALGTCTGLRAKSSKKNRRERSRATKGARQHATVGPARQTQRKMNRHVPRDHFGGKARTLYTYIYTRERWDRSVGWQLSLTTTSKPHLTRHARQTHCNDTPASYMLLVSATLPLSAAFSFSSSAMRRF